MKLSKNFSLSEMTFSQTAVRKSIDNTPTPLEQENLEYLCENILQPARNNFGPIIVSSGYRSHDLNEEIGGAPSSQHPTGEAADFKAIGVSNYELAFWLNFNTKFDQLILEHFTEENPHTGWVHCSCSRDINRKEVLRAYKNIGQRRTFYEHHNF